MLVRCIRRRQVPRWLK